MIGYLQILIILNWQSENFASGVDIHHRRENMNQQISDETIKLVEDTRKECNKCSKDYG